MIRPDMHLLLPGLMLLCLGGLCAQGADPDLPGQFDPGVAKDLLENPPFTRALNLSESLQLTGVAYVEGKPVATIMDKSTNKSYVVTQEPNAQGWRLAEATPSTQLRRAEVKIVVGSEIIPVRYSETQMAPKKKGGVMPSRIPTENEFTGHDSKGSYVRAVPYMSDEDREKFRTISRDDREKILNIVHDHREMLFKASHEDRADFVKKAFDSVVRK